MVRKVGKYELGKTLGVGNFSKVKLATHTETGENFALKIIDKEQIAKEHMENQMMREIAILKLLKHPNIVTMKEVMHTANHIYIVLELVTGGELFDKIVAAKRFDEHTARKYFHQLILGVLYSHKQGIAHRDLKPENLLLDGNGSLKISDFGLANLQRGGATGQGTLLQTVCGTPNYVAPEVLKEKGYNGIVADVWSCGVVLYVMLAGRLPFDHENTNALFNLIERGQYDMDRHIKPLAADLIKKCLAVDPMQRITMEEIVEHHWFQTDFDPSTLLKMGRIAVEDDDVKGAMSEAQESKTRGGEGSRLPNKVQERQDLHQGCDAFDLISRMSAGSMNPLVSYAQGNVKASTCFLLHGGAQDVFQVLNDIRANPQRAAAGGGGGGGGNLHNHYNQQQQGGDIKGFVDSSKGFITYLCIVIPTVSPSLAFVEIRRGKGDLFQFYSFYRALVTALGPRIRSTDTRPDPQQQQERQ